jgi:hypothetical protein
MRWIAGTIGLAAIITAVTIAVWPASAADKARADGENLGQAVGALYHATSTTEVDAAISDVNSALVDTRNHAGDELNSQLDDQADALNRAADGFVGTNPRSDSWDADLYQSELDYAVDDLVNNADDFANQRSDVKQAYYDGFQSGLPSDLK